MFARRPALREAAHAGAGRVNVGQRGTHRRLRAPVETIFKVQLVARFHRFFRLPEADHVIQRFTGGWDLHQRDRSFPPVVARLNPQARALVIPAHHVLVVGEIAIELQQAEPFRVFVQIGIKLQLLRVIERTADPLPVAAPHCQAVGVVDLRVNGVAHAAFVVATAEHAGHRRDAQLLNVLTRVEMVFHLHDHLALLAVDHEFIGTGDARAVQQRIDGKGGIARLDGFKPEGGEVRELFRGVGKGIYRQTARGKTVLVGIVHRAEIARPEERDDIAARQLRRFKGAEARKAEIALPFQLFGIDTRVTVAEQLRAEVDLARHRGRLVQREHPHAAAEPHSHMEELHVQLTPFNVVPQRLFFIVADGVIRLRRHGRQRLRQRTRRATPRGFRQVMRHGLQYGEVKPTALTVSDVRVSRICRFGKQGSKAGGAAQGCHSQRAF